MKTSINNFFSQVKSDWKKSLLFLLLIIIIIPKNIFNSPSVGLDSSWLIGLELAIKNNFIFGQDIVFTYGPLAYLYSCLNIYKSSFEIILFHFFHVGNIIYFLYYIFSKEKNKGKYLFLFFISFLYGATLFTKLTLSFLFVCLFHMFHFLKYNNKTSIFIFSLYAIISPFIKVDFSFILFFIFISFYIYNLTIHQLKLKFHTIILVITVASVFILFSALNIDFTNYIHNCFYIINSYSDAMVIVPSFFFPFICFGLIILLFYFSIILKLKTRKDFNMEIFGLFNVSIFIFLIFKYGVLRHDSNHFIPPLIYIIYTLVLFFNFSSLSKKSNFEILIFAFTLTLLAQIESPLKNFEKSIKQEPSLDLNKGIKLQKFSQPLLDKIGDSSVDFLGSNISFIHFNNLKYNPRPIFQSYSAYSKELINLNIIKYESLTAPNFIFHEFEQIGNRVPYWNEPKTYLSVLKNYIIEDSVIFDDRQKSLLLFKKRKVKKDLQSRVLIETIINCNENINIPKSEGVIFLELQYNYTFLGKIRRLLFQPSIAQIQINDFSYDLIKPIIESGAPINIKIDGFDDVKKFYESFGKKNQRNNNFKVNYNTIWIERNMNMKLIEYKLIDD